MRRAACAARVCWSTSVRHSRSAEFDEVLGVVTSREAPRWTDLTSDPNHAAALASRADVLRRAWRPPIRDRVRFLEERCRARRVLDVGCVAHDVARMDRPQWLHGRLAAVAERCIGVDVLAAGVNEMQKRGYHVVLHDLRSGLGPLAAEAPFDVIIAGELIEHVESMDMLFRLAAEALTPEGRLILTTPNPYAPHRVRAGQLGLVWENVDHILYAFPSGVAELAERHGLFLAEAAVTDDRRRLRPKERVKALRRWLRGSQWVTVGFATAGIPRVQRVGYGPKAGALHGLWRPRRRFLGETFVYGIGRAAPESPCAHA
ncbi:MAG: methyltransferase domain-containing protein [Acidimicrobiales bacterium]